MCDRTLQHAATHCNSLQDTATHVCILQETVELVKKQAAEIEQQFPGSLLMYVCDAV